jgi:hypothetical protein
VVEKLVSVGPPVNIHFEAAIKKILKHEIILIRAFCGRGFMKHIKIFENGIRIRVEVFLLGRLVSIYPSVEFWVAR